MPLALRVRRQGGRDFETGEGHRAIAPSRLSDMSLAIRQPARQADAADILPRMSFRLY